MQVAKVATFAASGMCGLVYVWILAQFYAYSAARNPIKESLIDTLARRGYETAYRVAITSLDLTVNVVFAIPFVLLIAWLRPRSMWTHVSIMWLAAVVFLYWPLLLNLETIDRTIKYGSYGLIVQILPLPLAFLLVSFGARIRQAVRHAESS